MLLARNSFDYNELPAFTTGKRPQTRKVKKISRQTKVGYSLIVFLTLVMAFLLTARGAEINSAGYEMIALKKQCQTLGVENQLLQSQISQLMSLQNIEYKAINKLGMQKPELAEGVQFVPVEYSNTGLQVSARTASAKGASKEVASMQQKNSLVQALASIINS